MISPVKITTREARSFTSSLELYVIHITYVIEVVGVGCVLPGWVMIVVL